MGAGTQGSRVDTPLDAPIECCPEQRARAQPSEEPTVSFIKIVLITLAFIIGLLFFGRFLF